jgi:hypothetical protein
MKTSIRKIKWFPLNVSELLFKKIVHYSIHDNKMIKIEKHILTRVVF